MKKRFLSVLLILCLVLSMTTTVFAAGGTFSGTGTESDPYLIEDLADLQALQAAVNGGEPYADKYFKQTAEIDLSSVANWEPIGNENTAHGFMGNYDGTYGVKPKGGTNNGGTVVPGGSGAGSSSPNPNVPVTGDNTPLTLLIVLMGICAAATAAIIVSRKRTSR